MFVFHSTIRGHLQFVKSSGGRNRDSFEIAFRFSMSFGDHFEMSTT